MQTRRSDVRALDKDSRGSPRAQSTHCNNRMLLLSRPMARLLAATARRSAGPTDEGLMANEVCPSASESVDHFSSNFSGKLSTLDNSASDERDSREQYARVSSVFPSLSKAYREHLDAAVKGHSATQRMKSTPIFRLLSARRTLGTRPSKENNQDRASKYVP